MMILSDDEDKLFRMKFHDQDRIIVSDNGEVESQGEFNK